MTAINTAPVLQGDNYVTSYDGQATTTLTDYVFNSTQDTIFVVNRGLYAIRVVALGEIYKVRPNEMVKITENTDTVQIKTDHFSTQPFNIKGYKSVNASGGAAGEDTVARGQIQDLEEQLTQQLVPKRYIFGGQLEKLKYSLSNPLEQFTGIVFIGDSITWGLGATGNPADYNTGRDGTLSDIRDNFASESFVNDFKRYIGSKYMGNVAPVISNWQYSTAGEAIATYTKQHILYPYGGDFTYTTSGTINSTLSRALTGTLTGWQLVINIDSVATGEAVISFPFTGEEFTLSIDSVTNSMDYELIVDGVSQGIFTTVPGADGMIAGFDNRRKHTFPYVRNKTVQIKTKKNSYVGLQTLRLGGIIIDKKIRVTNQGIIGTKAFYYKTRNMTGNTSGDGVAVGSKDNYIFCQLGSNDRLIETAYAKGSNEFKKNLKLLVDELKTLGEVILMVANPVSNESTSSYSFNMQDARNAVYRLAKESTLDFIDNYSVFGNVSTSVYTIDGLHPNDIGYEVISRNIINSLEFN
jgi:lysophospholipase L1-like esterase